MRRGRQMWEVDPGVGPDGRRRGRRFFESIEEAEDYRRRFNDHLREHGLTAPSVSVEVFEGLRLLLERAGGKIGVLSRALDAYLRRPPPAGLSFAAVAEEVMAEKIRRGHGGRHVTDLGYKYRRLGHVFGARDLASIGREEIKRWMAQQRFGRTAHNQWLSALRQVWKQAAEMGVCDADPTRHIGRMKVRAGKGDLLRAAEWSLVLETLRSERRFLPLLPVFLLRSRGLRTSELVPAAISRAARGHGAAAKPVLRWAHIDWQEGTCTVPAEVSKTGVERAIYLRPHEVRILRPLSGPGDVAPRNYWRRYRSLQEHLGFRLPRNGVRRSCASFRLAAGESIAEVGLEMGTSFAVLQRNYAIRQRAAEAEAFEEAVRKIAGEADSNCASDRIG